MHRCKLPTMRRVVLGLLIFMSACTPALTPAPVVTTPKFPDFMMPAVPPEFASTPAAINENRGWAFLQSGDLKTAEHEFTAALKNEPALLSGGDVVGISGSGPQGCESRAGAFRHSPRAAAQRGWRALRPGTVPAGARTGQRCDVGVRIRAGRRSDPGRSQASRGCAEVPRARAGNRTRARGGGGRKARRSRARVRNGHYRSTGHCVPPPRACHRGTAAGA